MRLELAGLGSGRLRTIGDLMSQKNKPSAHKSQGSLPPGWRVTAWGPEGERAEAIEEACDGE